MGKMLNAIMIALAIEIAMYLFVKTGSAIVAFPVFNFIINSFGWSSNAFVAWLITAIGVIGVGTVVLGLYKGQQDWVFRAGLGATFITFGMIVAVDLFTFISSQVILGSAHFIIAGIIVAPLSLFYLLTVVDFISAKD